jgi:hypothetical protein
MGREPYDNIGERERRSGEEQPVLRQRFVK